MNALLPTPILADLGDWMRLIVPAIFVIIWVLSQVLGGGKEKARPRQQRPARGVRPPGGNPPQQGGLSDEIESFLRRVQQQAGAEKKPERPPQQRPRPVAQPQVIEAELVDESISRAPLEPLRRKTAPQASGRRPLDTGRVGKQEGTAEAKLERHVTQVFDHQLGTLSDTSAADSGRHQEDDDETNVPQIPTTAAEIGEMLSGPENVRKAVVLSEILNRPEHRW